jgi:undecaprenyl pyrophosphate synthase
MENYFETRNKYMDTLMDKNKRIKTERFLDRYNHIMEFVRTLLAITTVILQLYIISRLI